VIHVCLIIILYYDQQRFLSEFVLFTAMFVSVLLIRLLTFIAYLYLVCSPVCSQKYPTFADLCRIVSLLSRDDDATNELSFHAAVCSCHTFQVSDNHVTSKLESVLNASKNLHYKARVCLLGYFLFALSRNFKIIYQYDFYS